MQILINYLWAKQIKKKHGFVDAFIDEWQLKTAMPKQTFPRRCLVPFCSSKLVRKSKFWERQIFLIENVTFLDVSTYFFNWTKEHLLKTSNKRTHVSI